MTAVLTRIRTFHSDERLTSQTSVGQLKDSTTTWPRINVAIPHYLRVRPYHVTDYIESGFGPGVNKGVQLGPDQQRRLMESRAAIAKDLVRTLPLRVKRSFRDSN